MKLFLVMTLMLHTINTIAQRAQTVAVSSTGAVIQSAGVLEARNHAGFVMPAIDSISVEDARNIYSLNILKPDAQKEFSRAIVKSFKMSLYSKTGEHVLSSSTEMITPEMKELLQTVQSGDKLYFEFIVGQMPDGTKRAQSPIGFRIK